MTQSGSRFSTLEKITIGLSFVLIAIVTCIGFFAADEGRRIDDVRFVSAYSPIEKTR